MARNFGIDLQASGVAMACAQTKHTEFSPMPKYATKMAWEKRYARLDFTYRYGDVFRSGDIVLLEKAYGQSRNAQTTLMQLFGIFIAGVYVSGARIEEINTGTWKKLVLGSGRATKEDVLLFAEEKLARKLKTQDEADAYCISLACEMLYPIENGDTK